MNPLTKYNPNAAAIPTNAQDAVRFWNNMAAQFARGAVASQVMCGFALIEVREESGFVQGGLRGQKPSNSVFATWGEFVEETFGMTDDTARKWMDMAKGVKSEFKKLGLGERFRALLATPPSQWNEDDTKLLSSSLAKVTDGLTQQDFFRKLGLAKLATGANSTGREPGCDNTRKKLTLSEEVALRKEQATLDWNATAKLMAAYKDKFLVLTDHEIEAQIAVLEQALNARRAWLKQPANNRQPAAITAMLRTK